MKRGLVAVALATIAAFAGASYAQVAFNLSQGWNLLGNSSSASINVASTFNDTSKFTTVWTWNKAASKWAFYAPSLAANGTLASYAASKGYDVLTSIGSKEGFWVNAPTATTFNGPVASGVTLVESDLVQGWNLMGSADGKTPSQLNQGLSASLSAAGKSMTTAWAWDPQGSAWRFYAPSLEAQGTLANYIAGKQYLAFTTALSDSEGFWLNIGASSSASSTSSTTSTTSASTTTTAEATTTTAEATTTTAEATTTTAVATTTTTTVPPSAAFVDVPVVNTPLDGVDVTLTCSSGTVGGTGKASQGTAKIAVDPVNCAPPYAMAVSGTGKMAGPDLKFGTTDDEDYDSATRAALKSVIQATDLGLTSGQALTPGTSFAAPAMTALTTMVAFALPPNPGVTDFSNAIANVQRVAGLSDPSLVYANPLTNGAVFNAATMVNEMVANAMTNDPTQDPAKLLKTMAMNTTAKLTDATIDPAALMGVNTASATVLQAQMATMQAKAQAMQSVADAIKATAPSGTTVMTPAAAATYLNTALAGTDAVMAQQAIAQAQLAQNTMKQMNDQMATMRVDVNILPEDRAAKMAAMAQGLNSVRISQDSSLQTAVSGAGTDATKIAEAIAKANSAAQSMMVASATTLMSTVISKPVGDLSTQFMSAMAGSITQQLGTLDSTQLALATSLPPAEMEHALRDLGKDMAEMALTAASAAGQVSILTPPSVLGPMLGQQVIGMLMGRAGMFGWMTSTQLQAWVDAIGTALAKNDPALLNPGSVGFALGNYFATSQPNLSQEPGTLTLTIGGTAGAMPLCAALGPSAQPGTNCISGMGGTMPLCSTLGTKSAPGTNCIPDTGATMPYCSTLSSSAIADVNCKRDLTSGMVLPMCAALGPSAVPGTTCTTTMGTTMGTAMPMCSTLLTSAQPGTNCIPDGGVGSMPSSCLAVAALNIMPNPPQNCTVDATLPPCSSSTLPSNFRIAGVTCTSGTGGIGGTLLSCLAVASQGTVPIGSGLGQNCTIAASLPICITLPTSPINQRYPDVTCTTDISSLPLCSTLSAETMQMPGMNCRIAGVMAAPKVLLAMLGVTCTP